MKNGENIEDWYRNEVSKIDDSPSDAIWDRLQNSMDTDNVWVRLTNSLNRWEKKIWWWKLSLRTTAIFLLLTASYYLYPVIFPTDISTLHTVLIKKNMEKNSAEEIENNVTPGDKFPEVKKTEQGNSGIFSPSSFVEKNKISDEVNVAEVNSPGKITDSINYNQLRQLTRKINLLPAKISLPVNQFAEVLNPAVNNSLNDSVISKPSETKWSIAGYGGIKNNWLLSPETFSALGNSGFNYTQTDFSFSSGIIAGYNLNEDWCIESGLLFTQGGQKYMDYEEGKSISREIKLNYLEFSGIAKKRFARHQTNLKIGHNNILMGIFSGYMINATEILNKKTADISKEYSKLNAGIIAGYELEYRVNNKFVIAPSFRYYQGTRNIFKGNNQTPKSFNSTFSASFELGISFRYSLIK